MVEPTRRAFLGAAATLSALTGTGGAAAGESAPEQTAGSTLARKADKLVYTAQRAAVQGDEETLHEAEQLYQELGQELGKIRVDVLGELEDFGGQPYTDLDLRPGGGFYDGGHTRTRLREETLDTATASGQLLRNTMALHFKQEADDGVRWASSVYLTPASARSVAMQLHRMAADAENSDEVEAGDTEHLNGGSA